MLTIPRVSSRHPSVRRNKFAFLRMLSLETSLKTEGPLLIHSLGIGFSHLLENLYLGEDSFERLVAFADLVSIQPAVRAVLILIEANVYKTYCAKQNLVSDLKTRAFVCHSWLRCHFSRWKPRSAINLRLKKFKNAFIVLLAYMKKNCLHICIFTSIWWGIFRIQRVNKRGDILILSTD